MTLQCLVRRGVYRHSSAPTSTNLQRLCTRISPTTTTSPLAIIRCHIDELQLKAAEKKHQAPRVTPIAGIQCYCGLCALSVSALTSSRTFLNGAAALHRIPISTHHSLCTSLLFATQQHNKHSSLTRYHTLLSPTPASHSLINHTHRRHASHILYAPVARADCVADPEPTAPVVNDEGWTVLWQGQHWSVDPLIVYRVQRICALRHCTWNQLLMRSRPQLPPFSCRRIRT